ncbi:MAG: hypothetical protein K9N55_05050, partial [Phycisphaerae bacterium]|nr:hypothetical protein [Phycisphaerae bacterium]
SVSIRAISSVNRASCRTIDYCLSRYAQMRETFLLFLLNYFRERQPSWEVEDQQKADRMKGVRYYLPRPFVHLKQSVPVAQRVAFVSLTISDDRTFYTISLPEKAPLWLRRSMPQRISSRQVLQASLRSRIVDDKGLEIQSGTEDGPNLAEDTAKDETDQVDRPSELTARTGFISDTDPVTRLSNRMDIVYLPDFEEQYVIQPKRGIGLADIETRLRNGWAAEVFSERVENSNLIPYIIRQVENASETAAGIFTTWAPLAMGVPPGTVPTPEDIASGLRLQSGTEGITGEQVEALLGGVILFKVAEVKIAQPGIYPILKPREIQHWLGHGVIAIGQDPQETFELAIQEAKLPWIRPDMAFIPVPPFTMVGFNVTTDIFMAPATQRMGIEHSTATGQNREGQPYDVEIMAELVQNHINNKILIDEYELLAAEVRVSEDQTGIIVRIVVPGAPPPSFTREQHDTLERVLDKAPEVHSDYLEGIELPLCRETLDTMKKAIDALLLTTENNKWEVILNVESEKRNTFALKKTGEPDLTEVDARKRVLAQWKELLQNEFAGNRKLDYVK